MRLLHNWFWPKVQIRPISFSHSLNMKLQTSEQSILVSIFCVLGLLWLSAGTYEATFSRAANVVSHLEQF